MIQLEKVSKVFGTGANRFTALDQVDLAVATGEITAVVGPSGAGKSTLSRCLNLLTKPTSGTVTVNGQELTHLGREQLRVARQAIGTVFQGSNLLARRTAAQNVALPLNYLGATRAAIQARVGELLDLVGLADKAGSFPAQLSGGQRQRIGIARALALRPTVLLADEATSGLDPDTTASILQLIRDIRDAEDLSVILITHEMDVVRSVADQVARLEHGRIVESGRVRDIVANPHSALAAQLLPARDAAPVPGGQAVWQLQFGSIHVALDWPQRLGEALGSPVSILSATIESIGSTTAGRATIGIDAAQPAHIVEQVLAELGLHGSPAGRNATAAADPTATNQDAAAYDVVETYR